MTTRMRILSGLALSAAALVIVPLSSDEAFAGGLGGTRSANVARSSTVTSSAHKLSTTSAQSHKVSAAAAGAKVKYNQMAVQTKKLGKIDKDPNKDKDKDKYKDKDHPKKHKPPVIIIERPGPIYAPAVVAVDPGCVYERRVRRLPGGGLKRVIVKICPST